MPWTPQPDADPTITSMTAETERPDGSASVTVTEDRTPQQTEEDKRRQHVEDVLREARERHRESQEAETQLRADMLDDMRFRAGEHWPENVRQSREADGRPCLTVNRLPQFIRQVVNQARVSRPSVQINPVDSGADVDTAEIYQGLIRNIEQSSHADQAYDTACEHQVTMGRGWLRILAEYANDEDDVQDLRIARVQNPFLHFPDPTCVELDNRDARYHLVVEDVPKDEFKRQWPKAQAASLVNFDGLGASDQARWFPGGKVRIAEYWRVNLVEDAILRLGRDRIKQSEVPEGGLIQDESGKVTGIRHPQTGQERLVESSRPITRRVVEWFLITAVDILEERTWKGQWIPIIPVLGDEIVLDGRVDYRGLVRDAKDPQRMYDYWVSSETESIALAPRAPFIGYEGQFEGHEIEWKQANQRSFPYLQVKPTTIAGQPVGLPQRNVLEPPIQAMAAAVHQADQDLKAVTGMFDATLGSRGPEQSGKAILARQKQGDVANFNYIDNLGRAIKAIGRQLVDLIPHYYDIPRIVRVLGADGKPKTVMVQAGGPPIDQQQAPKGVDGVYDLGVGRYDVTVSVGPSHQSQRQESVDTLVQFVQAYPAVFPAIGDILAENMDWPGAQVVAKRLKKMLPPQLQDEDNGQEPIPPQVQQQMAQAQQAIQELSTRLKDAEQTIETKQLELASREQIAAMQTQAQVAIAMAKTDMQAGVAALKAEYDRISTTMAFLQARHDQEIAAMQQQAPGAPAAGGPPPAASAPNAGLPSMPPAPVGAGQ